MATLFRTLISNRGVNVGLFSAASTGVGAFSLAQITRTLSAEAPNPRVSKDNVD